MEKVILKNDVIQCSRCGIEHKGLAFYKFHKPLEIGEGVITHWAICPVDEEPIFLREEECPT